MEMPNEKQQELFMNDISALVSILNANKSSRELCTAVNERIAQRVNMYFSPMIVIKTEE